MAERIEIELTLRERNQLTLPDRVATRLGAEAGDRLLLTIDPREPEVMHLRRLPRSYAGALTGVYGRTAEEQSAYLVAERASWDPSPAPAGQGPDGTRYLSFEESKRVYRQTDVTRERYERDPKLRWPKCEVCGRSIARLNDHLAAHRDGRLDGRGVNTDPAQRTRSRRRVEKWRAALARKASP